jgi:hypothetical protein
MKKRQNNSMRASAVQITFISLLGRGPISHASAELAKGFGVGLRCVFASLYQRLIALTQQCANVTPVSLANPMVRERKISFKKILLTEQRRLCNNHTPS